jgi:hypothetical protein
MIAGGSPLSRRNGGTSSARLDLRAGQPAELGQQRA